MAELKKKNLASKASPAVGDSPARAHAHRDRPIGSNRPLTSILGSVLGLPSRKVFALLAVVVTIVAAGLFLSLVRMSPGARHRATDSIRSALHLGSDGARSVAVERVLLQDGVPTNSVFKVSTTSRHYTAQTDIDCFTNGCRARNNLLAYRECPGSEYATQYNTLGVRTMERLVTEETHQPADYNSHLLQDAVYYFGNATKHDPQCPQATTNLGLALLRLGKLDEALKTFQTALDMWSDQPEERALVHVFAGLGTELRYSDRVRAAREHYDKARGLDAGIERQWWGVLVTVGNRQELSHLGTTEMVGPLLDCVLYKFFSPTAISAYGLLPPGSQDFFIQQSYSVVRKIVPPFVLAAVQRCYNTLIDKKFLNFGDTQSKRYVAYNDRCGRFLQFQLTDYLRSVIAHNAKPSYTYFGGYREGAELAVHNDREQCEFTISLTLQQNPAELSWALALKDFDNKEQIADLNTGDGLIFMGRILKHYRKGTLDKGEELSQIFMHYVNRDFAGSLN